MSFSIPDQKPIVAASHQAPLKEDVTDHRIPRFLTRLIEKRPWLVIVFQETLLAIIFFLVLLVAVHHFHGVQGSSGRMLQQVPLSRHELAFEGILLAA